MSSTPAPPHGPTALHAVQLVGRGVGGSGVHVRSLAAGLVARGIRVTVVATPATAERYGFAAAGAVVARLPERGGLATAPLCTATTLRAACAGADLVHAHGLQCGLMACSTILGQRRPLVVTWHTRSDPDGVRGRMMPLLERRVSRSARVVLGATTDLVDGARRRGARDARLAPIAVPAPRHPHPGGDGAALRKQQVRAELGAPDRPLVLTAAPLDAYGTHEPLLEAARMWRALPEQPLLAVAGEGPARGKLQRRIDAEKLPVRLLGRRDDLPRLLAAADVAVLSSPWEARPVLAQEALHAGAPLVATAVGGVPELVGDAAELVPYGDARALADAVAALLHDPAHRAALSAAGRAQAGTWPTEDDTVTQVLSIYDELMTYGEA
ncbi:glycosyltransferase family 4 protein [Streptomyces sp. NBC_01808]|uniref:glycosyltransferase family 4 protein n=1 Tax=Streptomyces sp. NBC_01808 TaxID=2975947 RepID=UPI002DDC6E97|nr:glycosyltransferase family 4 protein [Streptomyces sp. NBC_01808]WSA37007.1 glycosyltransferase family 4 protein [Streptomyces sp. NBC_01808]